MADVGQLTVEWFERWWKETGEYELRQLLLWRWDPLGVAEAFPIAADEYDGYANPLASLLRRGAQPGELTLYLASVEHDSMGGSFSSSEHLRYVGRLLADWYEDSVSSWEEFGPLRR